MKTLKLFVAIRACYPWDKVKSILFRKENLYRYERKQTLHS